MKLCAIETKELEDKVLTRFAENQNDELLEDLSDYVINSQEEIERLNNIIDKKEQFLGDNIKRLEREVVKRDNIINDIKEYVNFLVIFNQTINGKFSETQWGQDILDLIGSDKK